jgi:hypothetical protein
MDGVTARHIEGRATTQFTTATDRLSGEMTRIDLTLTVVK